MRQNRTCGPFSGTLFKSVTVGVIGAVFVDDDVAAAEIAQAFEQLVKGFVLKFGCHGYFLSEFSISAISSFK
jgi:hypothetical protein